MLCTRLIRCSPRIVANQRWFSSAVQVAIELPTRHSVKQKPRVCSDLVELKEETARLLETPVGDLFARQATANGGIEEAYDVAYNTIAKAEYLQIGHASQIVGTLYAAEDKDSVESPDDTIQLAMKPLIARMQQEGESYLQLRQEKQIPAEDMMKVFLGRAAGADEWGTDETGYLPGSDDESASSSSSSSGSSSSSDDDSDDSDEEQEHSKRISKDAYDFSPPGPTAKMQEALLDAMACVGNSTPREYFDLAQQIMAASDLDKGTNVYTLPTHVTYNAALRGISKCNLASEMVRDEALSSAFSLYNALTHSLHLPRNSMTFVYMFQIIEKAFPASRVRGNISCTLWDHACQGGVANEQVIEALQEVHRTTNGPEFQILLDHISGPLPQKYRRFVKKYRHSTNY